MINAIVRGGLLGGLVLFVWGAISWMLLPWHNVTFESFRDEKAVASALRENAAALGVYTSFPAKHDDELAKTGPVVFAAIQPAGTRSMAIGMVGSLVAQILAAAIVSLMVWLVRDRYYPSRMLLVVLFGTAAAIYCHLAYWNWFGFSMKYTTVMIADTIIGWALAGAVIAKVAVAKPKAA